MTATTEDITLGEWLRTARIAKGPSLRATAESLQVTPSYLSDIENDRRVPAEDVLQRLAGLLDLDPEEAMVRAGRFGEETERYLKRQPEAVRLFRRISEAKLSTEELRLLQQRFLDVRQK